jgi:Holliday junction resolvase RusA-like endonuclease
MKVLDLKGADLISVNEKYGYNPKSGKLYLSSKYRAFKELIVANCVKEKIQSPYEVFIKLVANLDIDNPLKPILDGLESAGVIDNDKNVHCLVVLKIPEKDITKQSVVVHIQTHDRELDIVYTKAWDRGLPEIPDDYFGEYPKLRMFNGKPIWELSEEERIEYEKSKCGANLY